jgi:GNAT superfamily N-acetyltransferase
MIERPTRHRENTSVQLTFRDATADDATEILQLVRGAYRGEDSRAGWTTEADLLADERIDLEQVAEKITTAGSLVLTAQGETGATIACCELVHRDAQLAYFGMFAVRPDLQAAGVGRQVLAEAERQATQRWHCLRMEMTVIAQRDELIAWYARRGYRQTDERRPFPYDQLVNGPALRDDLYFAVLVKDLAPRST